MKNSNVRIVYALLLVLTIMLAGVAHASYPKQVTDQFNRTIEIAQEPLRIVSGSPANTRILLDLGLVDRIVGVTNWTDFPEVSDVTSIGDIVSPDVEKIIALEPDVFLASNLTGKDTVDLLTKLGVAVVALQAHSFAGINQSVEIIGQVTGTGAQATTILESLDQKLQAVREVTEQIRAKDLNVLMIIWDDPLWTAGPGSFHHEALEMLGATNIAGESDQAWLIMDIEVLVTKNPDVIFADMDHSGLKRIMENPRFQTLAAIEKGQVYPLENFSLPTPALYDQLVVVAEFLLGSE